MTSLADFILQMQLFLLTLINYSTIQTVQVENAGYEDKMHCQNPRLNQYTVQELNEEDLFTRGHLKPFGSHRPPDEIVEELPFMISPEDFYMNYVVKHKPVVLKGT